MRNPVSGRNAKQLSKSAKKDGPQGNARSLRGRSRFRTWLWENIKSVAVALLLFLIVRAFIIQAFRIPSQSMEDTLLVGDFLFVNKFLYGAKVPGLNARLPAIRDIHRGDVVVFKNPTETARDTANRLSLWLYQITENEFLKNQPPTRVSGSEHRRPPLAINLCYLL